MEPGDHNDCIPDAYPVKAFGEPGFDVQPRIGRSFGALPRGFSHIAQH
jgi:hypothetical protein